MNHIYKFRNAALAASFVCFGLCSTTAHAIILVPGATVALSGTTDAANPALAGTVLVDNLYPFTMTEGDRTIDLMIQDRVVKETASGTLDFYMRVFTTNAPISFSSLQMVRSGFALGNTAEWTDVNYRTDGLGELAPESASRQTAYPGYISFNFNNPTIGEESDGSYFMMIRTQATSYSNTGTLEFLFPGGATAFGPVPAPVYPSLIRR